MARAPSRHTWRLLRALTRSEKRYVRLHLERLGDARRPAWLELFDALADDDGKDDELLLARCPSVTSRKALSQARSTLRERIMDGLRDYYAEGTPEIRLLRRIADIEILIRKQQLDLAARQLQSAWRTASRMSWTWSWPKLAQLDAFLARNATKVEAIFTRVGQIEDELPERMEETEEALRFNLLATRIFGWIRQGGRYEVEPEAAQLEAIADHPLLGDPPPEGRLEARMRYHEILGIVEFHRRNYARSLDHRRALVELFSADPRRLYEEPRRYVVQMNNLIISAMRLDDYDEVIRWIGRLREFAESPRLRNRENLAANVFSNTYSIELYYLLNRRMYDRIDPVVEAVRRGLARYGARLPQVHRMDFDFLLARAGFETGRYGQCLSDLHPVLNEYGTGWRQDIHVFARILNLLTHYELGNYRVLDAALTNFRRFAKQARHRNRVTQRLLRLLKRLNFRNQTGSTGAAVCRFAAGLEHLGLEPGERVFITETGLGAWLDRYAKSAEAA